MNEQTEKRILEDKNATLLDKLKAGFKDRYSEGREDYRQAFYAAREAAGKDTEATRIGTTLATNPTQVMMQDLIKHSDKGYKHQREQRGMGLAEDRAIRIGQVLGTLGNDLTQDHSRGLWWLLNAPQATANVINETALAWANPDLFKHEKTKIGVPQWENGKLKQYVSPEMTYENKQKYKKARAAGLINDVGVKQRGVGQKDLQYTKRKYNPGDVAALGIPTGIAINAGIGLLNPLGGSGGYSAVLPSQDDPSKTSNAVLEVAAKYILGKTGNLLPYDEFSKHRPDVSREDYNRYKAFKYDKGLDVNPLDGDFTIPTGVIKGTMEGIHGPEIQFLGRSLPATTTLTPFLGALAGGMLGVRSKRPIKHGLAGGMAGLAAGGATGIIAEEIRRRAVSNTTQLEGGNAEQYL